MSEENINAGQNFIVTKEQILSLAKNLTYDEKLKLVFSLIPWNDFHNYKYREEVARMALGLPPRESNKTTGEDLPGLSLKSIKSKPKRKKDNKYVITPSQTLGQWGRIDLDNTFDKKDTVSDIWGDDGVILRMKIFYDDNFEKLYQSKKDLKLKTKTEKKNKVDMGGFTIKDLIDFNVKYVTLFIDKNDVTAKFPLSSESGE
tara:strand:+ start:47 stop:652 length:606 start_codon:yes stop_codon:yes gene_type:complete